MKNKLLYFALSFVAALLFTSCNVDKSYDLSDVNDSNIGMGTDESTFEMPLFDMTLPLSDLISDELTVRSTTDSSSESNAEMVLDILFKVSALLPSVLSEDYADGIDLNSLSDKTYVEGLVSDLFDELATSSDKRVELFEMLVDEPDYVSELSQLIDGANIDVNTMSVSECADELGEFLNDSANTQEIAELQAQVVDLIVAESANINTDFNINESVSSIDIGDDILDILGDNLVDSNNYLAIWADVTTNLPLDVEMTLIISYTDNEGNISTIELCSKDDFDGVKGVINDIETLKYILSDLTITATINLNNYVPTEGGLDLDDKVITLKFTALKSGSVAL